jgi:hypothetical protein
VNAEAEAEDRRIEIDTDALHARSRGAQHRVGLDAEVSDIDVDEKSFR